MGTQLQEACPTPACSKPAAGKGFKTTTPILLLPGHLPAGRAHSHRL